ALQAFDEPQLPQRAGAVEHLRLHALEQREQLRTRSRAWQRREAHVVRDIEALVVDPDRPAEVERYRHRLLPEARYEVEARRHEVTRVGDAEAAFVVEERCALEDRERSDVHWRLDALEGEEARVEAAEPVVAVHRAPRVRPLGPPGHPLDNVARVLPDYAE